MQITGRITADAQVHTVKGDRQVVNFTVAVNDSYRNKQTGEWIQLTEYYRCAYWLSPKVAQSLTKGALVELTGRASASAWTGKDGEPMASLNFHTSQIKFHGGGRKSETVQADTKPKNDRVTQSQMADDLPF